MKDGYACVASFTEPLQANLAKTKLQSEGIDCYLTNEHMVRMNFFYSQALGGVQLFVPEQDLQRAREALEGKGFTLFALPDADESGPVAPSKEPNCPRCHSGNVYNDRRPRLVTTIAFYLGLPFAFFRKRKRCSRCGFEWK